MASSHRIQFKSRRKANGPSPVRLDTDWGGPFLLEERGMPKKIHEIAMKQLTPETLAELEAIGKSPAKSLDEVIKRQALIAGACVGLHKSILSLVDVIQAVEDRRAE